MAGDISRYGVPVTPENQRRIAGDIDDHSGLMLVDTTVRRLYRWRIELRRTALLSATGNFEK
jgi:hypothetical protein